MKVNQKTRFMFGNTGIAALETTVDQSYSHPKLDWIGNDRLILITAHRRENLGEPMNHMCKAIKHVLEENENVKAIYSIHVNPVVRKVANAVFSHDERIHIIEPLEVLNFHNFMARSYLVLTVTAGVYRKKHPVLVFWFW